MLIGGFNLNNDKEVNIETFFRFRKWSICKWK
jgi:hypothetical protein